MDVVVRRVGHSPGREAGLVNLQIGAIVEFARQDGAKFIFAVFLDRQFIVREYLTCQFFCL